MSCESFDGVVIGGGPVGAALALALDAQALRVLLIEAREAVDVVSDTRPLALSYGSRLILERLGVWEALAAPTPIERIHISQQGRFGRTVLTARDAELPALGYVIGYAALVRTLEALLTSKAADGVLQIRRGARVSNLAHDSRSVRVDFDSESGGAQCVASFAAIADGAAEAAGLAVRVVDYGQGAVAAHLEVDRPHENTAFERFTPGGPVALLPSDRGYALVWTTSAQRAQALCDLAPEAFLAALQSCFGERVGRLRAVGTRTAHRLTLRVAGETAVGRAAIIGNAAQSLHPVAGQGFNLGLRDAWELASEVQQRGADHPELLHLYRARRRVDRGATVAFTHALVNLFSNDLLPLALARGVGLSLLDCVPPVKNYVVRRMIFGARG